MANRQPVGEKLPLGRLRPLPESIRHTINQAAIKSTADERLLDMASKLLVDYFRLYAKTTDLNLGPRSDGDIVVMLPQDLIEWFLGYDRVQRFGVKGD